MWLRIVVSEIKQYAEELKSNYKPTKKVSEIKPKSNSVTK